MLSCEGQARDGHQVHLAFGPIYGPEGSLLERVRAFRAEGGRGITTHEVPDMVREVSPLRDRRAKKQLLRLLEEIKPDVIHTHSSKAGVLGRLAGWEHNRRVGTAKAVGIVHTIHGPPFMPVEGSFLGRLKRRLNNRVYTLAERHAAKRCHVIVSVADAMTREFRSRGIGRAEQFVTVRSGMETRAFLAAAEGEDRSSVRMRLGIGEGDFVVGTVARLAEHKGHDDVLDALGEELQANPTWKLLWVGDGWWRERLLSRVKAMGLEGRVITTGLVPPEQVPGMMRAMDVLAHPSAREGLPRTVPQALLCGIVPVAYDVDGTGEICIDGKTGRLIPFGDVEWLRRAIGELAANPALRARLAAAGKAIAERDFSAEGMVTELERVYGRAIELARG